MVARPEELVQHLFSADSSTKLKAVREVKNQIIGNKSKKLSYIKLGAVPRVVELLASEAESNYLKVQSAAAVGSFAYGVDDGLRAVLESGGVASLVKALYSPDEKVVEAAVRSLKMIYQSAQPPPCEVLDARAIERLVTLLEASNHSVAESAAVLLARAAKEPRQKSLVSSRGGVQGLLHMLLHGEKTGKEAAVGALAALCSGDKETATAVASRQDVILCLLELLKDSKAYTRFTAASCLTSLANCMQQPDCCNHGLTETVQRAVLLVLVKLLGNSELAEEIPHVLYDLIADDTSLQQAASDADAIAKLALFLQDDEKCSDKLKEGAYRALGSLCMNSDEAKKQLHEGTALSSIVKSLQRGMQAPTSSLRAAACSCLRALSRSQWMLCSNTIDGSIGLQLVRLLGDPDYEVQAAASAALPNLLLNFTPAKEVVLEAGGLSAISCLVHSMDATLRLNGVWALQNLLYGYTEAKLRKDVMSELMWEDVKVLLDDPEQQVQLKVLCLLRNLLYDQHAIIQAVLDWTNNELLPVLAQKLEPSLPWNTTHRMHALYVMVNSAAGTESHKDSVMKCGVVQYLDHYLSCPQRELRVAVLWILINITDADGSGDGATRVQQFKDLGLQDRLLELQNDVDLDVKERVKTVLDQFRRAGAVPGI